ncbi:MAG: pilus assembly PilX N-terminal domain-containing protein [Desulfobacterales bacterium]|nr:pilus assembly PilX N-terminal domain-containing protein [Desulfobacterales bacterium]
MQVIRMTYNNEKGFVLPVGLMFLAILALLGTTAVIITTTDLKIGTNYKLSEQAFYLAEAGINEAMHRLNLQSSDSNFIGEAPGSTPTPGWGRYIVLQTGADIFKDDPAWALSGDSLDNDDDSNVDETNETYPEVATLQTIDGTELNYLIKLYYKIEDSQFQNGDGDNNEVVFYGQDFGYGSNAPLIGTHPVKIIESIGFAENNSKRTIKAEVTKFSLDIEAKAAMACDEGIKLTGNSFISGFNHDVNTTSADNGKSTTDFNGNTLTLRGNGIDNHGGKEEHTIASNVDDSDILLAINEDEDTADVNPRLDEVDIPYGAKIISNQSTYLPGAWTTGDYVDQAGGDDIYGGNNVNAWKDESPANTWITLDQMLGISSEQLADILDNADVTNADTEISGGNQQLKTAAPQGIIYIDNGPAGTNKNFKIGAYTPSYNDGWGLMYITGDFEAENLTFRGLIFVEGEIKISANLWLLGSIAVKGKDPSGSGGADVLYSKDAIDNKVGDAMDYVVLSWKEVY